MEKGSRDARRSECVLTLKMRQSSNLHRSIFYDALISPLSLRTSIGMLLSPLSLSLSLSLSQRTSLPRLATTHAIITFIFFLSLTHTYTYSISIVLLLLFWSSFFHIFSFCRPGVEVSIISCWSDVWGFKSC